MEGEPAVALRVEWHERARCRASLSGGLHFLYGCACAFATSWLHVLLCYAFSALRCLPLRSFAWQSWPLAVQSLALAMASVPLPQFLAPLLLQCVAAALVYLIVM